MATMATTAAIEMMNSPFRQLRKVSNYPTVMSLPQSVRVHHDAMGAASCSATLTDRCHRSSSHCNFSKGYPRSLAHPISAVGSGLEASISDPKENVIHVKNAKIIAESQDDDKIQVRVDVTGEETRIVFEKVLTNLARTAPPVPGFRRQKGGKTSKVPKDFLLQMLGEERVTNFVIQEIVSSTLADYAKKENLTVKDNKINTIQTAEELRSLFSPGKEFGFNATLELEISSTATSRSSDLED